MGNYKMIVGFLIGIFSILLIYHLVLNLTYSGEETVLNRWVVPLMSLVMIYGSYFGLKGLKKTGFDSTQSKGLFFASVGTFFLGLGFLTWAYYAIFLDNDLPFPSIADYFWLFHTVLIIIAFFYFFQIFRSSINFWKIIIALVLLAMTTYMVVRVVGIPTWELEGGVDLNETFFNLFYSVSDLILIAISVIILTVSGGKIYSGLFVYNLGLIFMVAADLIFAFRTEVGISWQGDISDVFFSVAGFLFSLGLIMFVKNTSDDIVSNHTIENTQWEKKY